jgi:fused signal recognition particle receptor
MSKKKGMFSWLGLGQKQQEETAPEAADVNESVNEQAKPSPVSEQQPITNTSNHQEAVAESNSQSPIQDVVSIEVTADELPAELEPVLVKEPEPKPEIAPEPEKKVGFFSRLKQGLTKTRQNLGGGLFSLFRGKKIDDELFEELETHLLLADVGVETTTKIIDSLTESASRGQLKDAEALYELLKVELKKIIAPVSQPLEVPSGDGPFVMLMVGVNGVGKTTTIGKLAKQFQAEGKSVMLAAGDTFRAAAVEQLQVWGERNDIPVVAQHTGADSASVIFDAISAAKSRGVDVLIADTAGRLQNKNHLMEELKKVVRVMKKLDVNAPHEVMLTLDAGTGQNALSQTKLFNEAVGLTGLTLTKLDGTAKGGVVFAIADKHAIPIRYLGVGEGIDDLRPFNGNDFIDALFTQDTQED